MDGWAAQRSSPCSTAKTHMCVGSQERISQAAQLAQEMAVQAAAIEAARSNVEHHYSYICTHFKEFIAWCAPAHCNCPLILITLFLSCYAHLFKLCRFQGQAHSHAEVLGRFERDLRLLSSVNILAGAQTQQYRCLADLVPEEQYCDWAAKCSAYHESLASKV